MNNFARLTIATSVIIAIFLAITFFFVKSNQALAPEALVPVATISPLLKTRSSTGALNFSLSSPSFENGTMMPSRYSCDAKNSMTPSLSLANAPQGTKSFALVMSDPDIPASIKTKFGISKFDHWVVYNIPGDTKEMTEGVLVGSLGINSAGKAEYAAPCPPKDLEPSTHRYHFRIYALAEELSFKKAPTLDELETTVKDKVLASAELIGLYRKQ